MFIAHQFPPISGSGSFRPAKFVKYLPIFGWQPLVITTKRIKSLGYDSTLSEDIPENTQIFRFSSPFPKPRDKVIKWLMKYFPILKNEIGKTYDRDWQLKSITRRMLRLVLKIIFIPLTLVQYPPFDPVFYWSIKIIFPAYKLIKSEAIEVIFTTSAPWSSLLSGLILKMITKRPWVADLRDPWTTEELRYSTRSWRGTLDRYFESLFLRNADIVIGVTPNWVADLQRLAGQESVSGKFELITNGYDESDFVNIPLPKLNDDSGIMISHVGSMFRGGLEPLLSSLQNTNGTVKERINFQLIGYIHPQDQAVLAKSTLKSAFTYRSKRITHLRALQIMRESHVLLLSLPLEYYPGKVFEYMRVGRPVLALVSEGSAANLIKEAQIGCVVNRKDTDRLSGVLEQIAFDYDGFVKQYYKPNREFIQRFERKILTNKLSSIFDRVIQH